MKEKIYTIPVNDAFASDCECPICAMHKVLNDNAVEYTMGPSYMEEDTRAMTDSMGFCHKHIREVYEEENRLGMSLVLKTHFDKVITDIKKLSETPVRGKMLFKKNIEISPVAEYVSALDSKCFVCNRIDSVFERYVDTVFYLWKSDDEFKKKFAESKGFCTPHFGLLTSKAQEKLSGDNLDSFITGLNKIYITNMERVRDDLAWFINKNDYKYAEEPWYNAKDAIPRAMTKINSLL